MTTSLDKLGPIIQWFVQDYKENALDFLTSVGTQYKLEQDAEVLNSDLSDTECGRIQRAFCVFEAFRHLFAAPENTVVDLYFSSQTKRFLSVFAPDEVEEVSCIRDYMTRRLWGVFEDIERDALQQESDGPIRKLGQDFEPVDWFSYPAKAIHLQYMEYMMSLGLPFLQEVFQSDGFKRANLIISNSCCRTKYLTEALSGLRSPSYEPPDFDDGHYDGQIDYANRGRLPRDFGRLLLKGLRDWGYMFWSEHRLQASGILGKDPKEIATYKFNDKASKWSVNELLRNSLRSPRKSLPTNEYAPEDEEEDPADDEHEGHPSNASGYLPRDEHENQIVVEQGRRGSEHEGEHRNAHEDQLEDKSQPHVTVSSTGPTGPADA
ncbi:MAG: hypothetical protein Q9218_005549 [Villophora microphyllina]